MKDKLSTITRNLRENQTCSEKMFWAIVRNRKLGVKFTIQFAITFNYEGKNKFFVADFYCFEKKLVVEIDGSIHEQQKEYDALRTHIINQIGIRVIRFKNEEVSDTDYVIEGLKKYLKSS